jgi:hypothetical protein
MELHIRDGLTAAQGVALQVEAHSIQNLLRDGHRSIQDIRHIAASADSVFVLASIGVERAMKLLLGLGSLRDEGRWPPPSRILGWGETLVELDASLEDALAVSALVARHRDYSALLLDDHRSDRLWHPLVDVLDCYGPAHQFSVVDRLAEVDDYWEAPLDSWNRFEFAILSHRPTLAEILPARGSDRPEGDQRRGRACPAALVEPDPPVLRGGMFRRARHHAQCAARSAGPGVRADRDAGRVPLRQLKSRPYRGWPARSYRGPHQRAPRHPPRPRASREEKQCRPIPN